MNLIILIFVLITNLNSPVPPVPETRYHAIVCVNGYCDTVAYGNGDTIEPRVDCLFYEDGSARCGVLSYDQYGEWYWK